MNHPTNAHSAAQRRPSGQLLRVLPWVISIALHIGFFVLLVTVVWLYQPAEGGGTHITPTAGFSDVPQLLPTNTTESQLQTPVTTDQLELIPFVTDEINLAATTDTAQTDLDILGIGGSGSEDGGAFSLNMSGTGQGPMFFGKGPGAAGAKRIVYVVDKSASMQETFAAVERELIRSISQLSSRQWFHVIFYSSGKLLEFDTKRLVRANSHNKRRFFRFLDDKVHVGGGTKPAPAIGKAFDVGAELIFFLTDGIFKPEEEKKLLANLRIWNRAHKVKVYTFAYLNPGGERVLQQIALEHGGEYKYIDDAGLFK